MPHVIVKHWPGKPEEKRRELAEAIFRDVVRIFGSAEHTVSIAMQEVPSSEWTEKVVEPDITHCPGTLYRKPDEGR